MAVDRDTLRSLPCVFNKSELKEAEAGGDPLALFQEWFSEALRLEIPQANAFTLATADNQGQPSARVLLLKEADDKGFVFYTNYGSRKGDDLASNPRAAMCFYWREMEKQVRIEGRVERVSREESADYFRTRPRESRLGAHASQQSAPIEDREALDRRFAAAESRFPEEETPLPDAWGGFRLLPHSLEFWQGRSGRLHDRLIYRRHGSQWDRTRLQP
ncbi:MAG: pyridoxamine 5'-phosphate oxidase [Leptospirales bacterium]|nr:pyridoxamine 5'-phosphate oxidase [Leptospirales bacterium]